MVSLTWLNDYYMNMKTWVGNTYTSSWTNLSNQVQLLLDSLTNAGNLNDMDKTINKISIDNIYPLPQFVVSDITWFFHNDYLYAKSENVMKRAIAPFSNWTNTTRTIASMTKTYQYANRTYTRYSQAYTQYGSSTVSIVDTRLPYLNKVIYIACCSNSDVYHLGYDTLLNKFIVTKNFSYLKTVTLDQNLISDTKFKQNIFATTNEIDTLANIAYYDNELWINSGNLLISDTRILYLPIKPCAIMSNDIYLYLVARRSGELWECSI